MPQHLLPACLANGPLLVMIALRDAERVAKREDVNGILRFVAGIPVARPVERVGVMVPRRGRVLSLARLKRNLIMWRLTPELLLAVPCHRS